MFNKAETYIKWSHGEEHKPEPNINDTIARNNYSTQRSWSSFGHSLKGKCGKSLLCQSLQAYGDLCTLTSSCTECVPYPWLQMHATTAGVSLISTRTGTFYCIPYSEKPQLRLHFYRCSSATSCLQLVCIVFREACV